MSGEEFRGSEERSSVRDALLRERRIERVISLGRRPEICSSFRGNPPVLVAGRSSWMLIDDLVELLFQLLSSGGNVCRVGNDEIGPTSFGFQ